MSRRDNATRASPVDKDTMPASILGVSCGNEGQESWTREGDEAGGELGCTLCGVGAGSLRELEGSLDVIFPCSIGETRSTAYVKICLISSSVSRSSTKTLARMMRR
jgi:hypothetical protein